MATTEASLDTDAEGPGIFDRVLKLGSGLPRTMATINDRVVELGLERHVAELDTLGYTVVPPDKVATPDVVDRIRNAVLRVAEKRTGVKHSVDANGTRGKNTRTAALRSQYLLFYLLFEDRVFEDWLDNPTLMALVSHTMREQAQLSSMVSFVKWKGDGYGPTLGLHSDSPASPEGVLSSTYDLVCNGTLALTDYSEEDGALAIVPGSHLRFRQPTPGEGVQDAIPIAARAGSLIFWRGNTWHGAYPKQTEGLRLNLVTYFCNKALKTQEQYQRHVPDEVLARHGERFARLLGADDPMGWREEGADLSIASWMLKTTDAHLARQDSPPANE